jgi:hypothetical protein
LALHPELAGQPSAAISRYIQEWHRQALPRIRTKDFRATWREAKALWEGVDPHKLAVEQVAAMALQEPPPTLTAERGYKPALTRLVQVCRGLQRFWGEKPFFLDVRTAARVVGVSKTTAAEYLQRLQRDGVVGLSRKGCREGRLASEWRYLGQTA